MKHLARLAALALAVVALLCAPVARAANDSFSVNGLPILAATPGGYLPAFAAYFPNGLGTASNPFSTLQASGDPCSSVAHVYTPINISTAANTKIVAGTSGKKTYICHLFLYAAAADNVAIVEGTGTNCGTGTVGVIGGATAAAGVDLTANQGWVEGAANNAIAATATAADDFCLITSAAVQLSGVVVSAQQ